jgi:aspartyl-tRNA(Asn)/glutamyl-tRNA(Gln) amidotransferase subunit C
MSVTTKDVEYVAALARLSLSEKEKEMYTGQLNEILAYMEQLNRLDTSKVEPLLHVIDGIGSTNVMRDDVVTPSLPREEALRNAPDRTEKFFKVPTVRGER